MLEETTVEGCIERSAGYVQSLTSLPEMLMMECSIEVTEFHHLERGNRRHHVCTKQLLRATVILHIPRCILCIEHFFGLLDVLVSLISRKQANVVLSLFVQLIQVFCPLKEVTRSCDGTESETKNACKYQFSWTARAVWHTKACSRWR